MAEDFNHNLVSLDDDNIIAKQLNYFKGSKDQYYRIRIPDIQSILMYRQHYLEGEGLGYMRCLKDRGEECPICDQVDSPITKFKVNILVYNTTTSDGSLPENPDFVSMTAQVLKFGIKMFAVLKQKHKKLAKKGGLGSRDLILHCTNEQFQGFDVDECDECASIDNPRLKAMAENLMKTQFVDFNTYHDRDLKFLTPVRLREYVARATGVKPAEPDTNGAESESSSPENIKDDSEPQVGGSIKDLI